MTEKYRFDFGCDGWKDCVLASDYDALAADRDRISLSLDLARADRDKWFNRARELEAFVKRVANSDMTEGAPANVVEARKLLRLAPETTGKPRPLKCPTCSRDNSDPVAAFCSNSWHLDSPLTGDRSHEHTHRIWICRPG